MDGSDNEVERGSRTGGRDGLTKMRPWKRNERDKDEHEAAVSRFDKRGLS